MTALEAILIHFDNAWSHDWESFRSVLDGVTEEEASWCAPCFADEPGAGSIRWHLAHLAYYKRSYTARLHGDREARSPDVPTVETASLAEDVAELERAHAAQREAIAGLAPDELTPSVVDFLSNTNRHDVWHSGQIALVRRLFRYRD